MGRAFRGNTERHRKWPDDIHVGYPFPRSCGSCAERGEMPETQTRTHSALIGLPGFSISRLIDTLGCKTIESRCRGDPRGVSMDVLDTVHALERTASSLLKESVSDRFGQVSPSLYESARLVSAAPWLTGHQARIRFLLGRQHPDGHWGGEGAYQVIPTLSATEALLNVLRRDRPAGHRDRVRAAAERGLRALAAWFSTGAAITLPDTVAVELLVPALVADINDHLGERR